MSISPLREPLQPQESSCCAATLKYIGFKPWKLGCSETILHAIPGVGIVTGATTCGCKASSIEGLRQTAEELAENEKGLINEDRMEICETPLESFIQLEEEKNSNRKALLATNLALCIIAGCSWILAMHYQRQ